MSLYSWKYPAVLVYMLQNTEYQSLPYLRWYWRTKNFSSVTYRRTLEYTKPATLLLWALRVGMGAQIVAGLLVLGLWHFSKITVGWQFGLALVLAYPIVWAHLVVLPLAVGRWLLIAPRQRRLIKRSEKIFRDHPGIKLAIAGSYGKTSMKELLLAVFGEDKDVAATPANKNVAISHAYFAQTLSGNEDIVIIEYGESAPGDIARFARITHPTHAIITGIAPAHLDRYKTVERAAADIFSVRAFVDPAQIYVNAESAHAQLFLDKDRSYQSYDQHGALGWKVSSIVVNLDGVRFTMKKNKTVLELHSCLIGRHHVGPLVIAAALADAFGMQSEAIKAGIAKTAPFEHRMQPYQLGGAWIIDDTYNGNIEGIRAGTQVLKELQAARKIYVTPGLVDQGEASNTVHEEMGRLIADADPDIVVLMQNSATSAIMQGLRNANYSHELRIEEDPLGFYTSLQAFVATGDIVLMQNDWTDNYA